MVIDSTGALLGTYRKMCIPHIRRDGVPGTGFEKYYFRPGDLGFPVFTLTSGLTLGILICYDRHFPENFRALALQGAQLICVPTTAPSSATPAWELELRAAAFANGVWVSGVNRAGRDDGGADRSWPGRSLLVDPSGRIRYEAPDALDVHVAELELDLVLKIQSQWGFFRDRRPDAYGLLAAGGRP